MSQPIEHFIKSRLPLAGVAGWGARLPNRSVVCGSGSAWLPVASMEQTVARLALAAESLSYHGIKPLRLSWVFERARIHVALRPDGACLALAIEKSAGPAPNQEVESLLCSFMALSAV